MYVWKGFGGPVGGRNHHGMFVGSVSWMFFFLSSFPSFSWTVRWNYAATDCSVDDDESPHVVQELDNSTSQLLEEEEEYQIVVEDADDDDDEDAS